MDDASDRELVTTLARGDRRAFTILMRRHGAAVYRYAWALADEPGQVDDLLQDTFLIMWKRRRKVTLVGESMLPWLLTTCRYTAYNSNRRDRIRRTIPLESVEHHARVDDDAAAREQLVWVRVEIASLTEIDQQLVELCLIEGRSYVDAAAHLGITVAAARKRIQRTRARLSGLGSEAN